MTKAFLFRVLVSILVSWTSQAIGAREASVVPDLVRTVASVPSPVGTSATLPEATTPSSDLGALEECPPENRRFDYDESTRKISVGCRAR